MPNPLSRLLQFTLRLIFWVFAAVMAVSLLTAALIVVALSLLKALITGRRPAPTMAFGRFQRFSAKDIWSGAAAGAPVFGQRPAGAADSPARPAGDVVDVEVREIRDDQRLP